MLVMCAMWCRMREKVGLKVVRALKRNNDGVSHAAIDMLCALVQVARVVLLCIHPVYLNGHLAVLCCC